MKAEKDGLSFQQRLWKGTETLIHAGKPLVLYLTLPALLTCVGMVLSGGRTAEDMIARSGRFYYALGIILTLYLLHRRCRKRGASLCEEATLEYRGLDWKKLFWLTCLGLGMALFFSALLTLLPLPAILKQDYLNSSDGLDQGTDQALALAATVILAPVAEEIIFRGYLLNRLLRWFGERESVFLSSAVFALCHVSVIWILYAFFMGVLLARVSLREDNIAFSIALHVGFNGNVLPIWLINRSPAARELFFSAPWKVALWGIMACLLAVWSAGTYRVCGGGARYTWRK